MTLAETLASERSTDQMRDYKLMMKMVRRPGDYYSTLTRAVLYVPGLQTANAAQRRNAARRVQS